MCSDKEPGKKRVGQKLHKGVVILLSMQSFSWLLYRSLAASCSHKLTISRRVRSGHVVFAATGLAGLPNPAFLPIQLQFRSALSAFVLRSSSP